MIRRNIRLPDGEPAWVLISQIEHARVAGELARRWGRLFKMSLPYDEVILPTIFHHDDGWDRWEAQPTIEKNGRPRAFTDMPGGVAHDIWRRSIDRVASFGPLAQFMVAQHFIRLRRRGDEIDQPDVRAFLNQYDARCADWLAQWSREDEHANTPAAAKLAVELLQMFDRLSLILCCTPSDKPSIIATLDEPLHCLIQGERVTVQPWPWTTPELTIQAAGRVIPAQPLTSDEALREQLGRAEPFELTWQIYPQTRGVGQ